MLERLGLDMKEMPGVEEVLIRTQARDLVIRNPSVSEIKAKGMRIFNVMGEDVEEVEKEAPKFTEEDVLLVAQQAGVSKEKATIALKEANGDLAKAILQLTG